MVFWNFLDKKKNQPDKIGVFKEIYNLTKLCYKQYPIVKKQLRKYPSKKSLSKAYYKCIRLFSYWKINILFEYKCLKMFSLIDMTQLYITIVYIYMYVYYNLDNFQWQVRPKLQEPETQLFKIK